MADESPWSAELGWAAFHRCICHKKRRAANYDSCRIGFIHHDHEGNILLVEDEEALQMALSAVLRREGYVVDSAFDGEDRFRKSDDFALDLIVLDIMLPGRNGLDLCRDIASPAWARLSSCSPPRGNVGQIVGLKLGADDYVTKPFDMLELMARIEHCCRRAPIRTGQAVYQFGSIRIETRAALDHRDVKVTRGGEPI